MTIITILLILSLIIAVLSEYVLFQPEGDVYVTPVCGFLFGGLHSKDTQEVFNNSEEIIGYRDYHTVQIALFFITFTFIWVGKIN